MNKGYSQYMLLLYAQQMKGRKLKVGEALDMLYGYTKLLDKRV